MNITRTTCCYCRQPRDFSADLHGCPQSLKAQAYVAGLVHSMKAMQEPSDTVSVVRLRRRREIAQNIKVIGGGVKPQN